MEAALGMSEDQGSWALFRGRVLQIKRWDLGSVKVRLEIQACPKSVAVL